MELKKNFLHNRELLYRLSVIAKGVDGLLELAGAILLMIFPIDSIQHFFSMITSRELSEDPRDLLANIFLRVSDAISLDLRQFFVIFLLLHGLIKLIMIFFLWKRILAAYPYVIFTLILLVLYQFFELFTHASLLMIFLLVIDMAIIGIIASEYVSLKKKTKTASS